MEEECEGWGAPTSLVLFSIPGVPGAHQLTGVELISVDGGQHIPTADHRPRIESFKSRHKVMNMIQTNKVKKARSYTRTNLKVVQVRHQVQ